MAVVGDGADWVWQETAKHFPRSVEILDYYHALQHLWAVGRACLPDEGACKGWIVTVQERLLKDEVRAVIREIDRWEPETAASCMRRRSAHR